MSDLKIYINKRKKQDPEFANNFEKEYNEFKFGVVLRQAREEAGFTQEQVAQKLNTNRSAISRIEKHARDIRLSTLEKFANALGKNIQIALG